MEDAVKAVEWVIVHAKRLGGNCRGIFLSGHSAGANIAANLVTGPWLEEVLVAHAEAAILGIVGISGVYTSIKPCGDSYLYNKAFKKMYADPVFGSDLDLLIQHSPIQQVMRALDEDPVPSCLLNNLLRPHFRETAHFKDKTPIIKVKKSLHFLIMNAENDLGLDHCGRAFRDILTRHLGAEKVRYERYPGTAHASIAIYENSLALACAFMTDIYSKKFSL